MVLPIPFLHTALRCVTLVLACTAAAGTAQRPVKPERVDGEVDPFTKNDPELLTRLGYERISSFVWIGDTTTKQVQDVLGEDGAIFIETKHFKLASTLRAFPWPKDKEWRESLGAELQRLHASCAEFKDKPKSIDPWLRAHLFAQRLEATYADFCERFGIDAASFPKVRGTPRGPDYMGEGPYLGQPAKYVVVLCHKALSAGTYTRTFHGVAASDTIRHNFVNDGNLAVVTAAEFAEKQLMDDRKLHCHVVYAVVHNLIDGYRFYGHNVPGWLDEGIPQWFARRVFDEFRNSANNDTAGTTVLKAHEWGRRVRLRVENQVWPRAEQLCRTFRAADLSFPDQMMAWSRVDHLMSLDTAKRATFLRLMKGPITLEPRLPTPDEILSRQEEALRQAFGWDYAAFDAAWVEFVLASYPKK